MFLEAALLGLIVGWVRGGTLKKLKQASLNCWSLALLGLAVQAVIWADFTFGAPYLTALVPGLHVLSFLPLLFFVYENIEIPGMALLGIGTFLNMAAITFNGGRMPVRVETLPEQAREALLNGAASPLHAAMTNDTVLSFLGDIIGVPLIWNLTLSVGDVLIFAGIFLLAQSFIKPKRSSKATCNRAGRG